ncbi:MAG: hypothetical protein GY870_21940 [archaeon]|nr:hypothetical protein [archaeon]
MKSLILCLVLLAGCDYVDYKQKCRDGEKNECVLYDGLCRDGDLIGLEVNYYRCCSDGYLYYSFDGEVFYTIEDMYNGVCN